MNGIKVFLAFFVFFAALTYSSSASAIKIEACDTEECKSYFSSFRKTAS